MKRIKLSTKLLGGFAAVSFITLLLGFLGFYSVTTLNGNLREITEVRLPSVTSLLDIAKHLESLRTAQRTLIIPGLQLADRERQFTNIQKAREGYKHAWEIYEPLPKTDEEAKIWQEFKPAVEAWKAENMKFEEQMNKLTKLDILDPTDFDRQVTGFSRDHYKLETELYSHAAYGRELHGGDDHTACAFGKWLASFTTNNEEIKSILQAIRPYHEAFHNSVKKVKELVKKGDSTAAVKVVEEETASSAQKTFEYFNKLAQISGAARETWQEAYQQLMGPARLKENAVLDLLSKLVQINQDVAAAEASEGKKSSSRAKTLTVIGILIAVGLALTLGVLLSKNISRSLIYTADAIATGAEQVSSAANQVASAAQQLSQSSTEQAAALQETAASLEEISSMSKQNAENSEQASTITKSVDKLAENGAELMARMDEAVNNIKRAADETGQIVKTIDEIAFQTNLLALNAAVEAARAGDAGKGFAVVAEEVRNLAQRSAVAARETAEKIQRARDLADGGVSVTEEVRRSLAEIKDNAVKAAALVAEIAAASKEQSSGLSELNSAMSQIDQSTQQNSAVSEESAAASEELLGQAKSMQEAIAELEALTYGEARTRQDMSHHTAAFSPAREGAGKKPAPQKGRKPAKTESPNKAAAKEPAPTKVNGAAQHDSSRIIPLDNEDYASF